MSVETSSIPGYRWPIRPWRARRMMPRTRAARTQRSMRFHAFSSRRYPETERKGIPLRRKTLATSGRGQWHFIREGHGRVGRRVVHRLGRLQVDDQHWGCRPLGDRQHHARGHVGRKEEDDEVAVGNAQPVARGRAVDRRGDEPDVDDLAVDRLAAGRRRTVPMPRAAGGGRGTAASRLPGRRQRDRPGSNDAACAGARNRVAARVQRRPLRPPFPRRVRQGSFLGHVH